MRDVFRRICTFAFIFGALTTAASGQHLAVGVKGGVPLLDAYQQNTSLPIVTPPGFFFHNSFNTKRYTVGPAVEVCCLPLNLRFEANALYTRLDSDSTEIGISPPVTNGPLTTATATRANSWQFPLLLKKEIPVGRVQPFGDIGYALRHVSGTSHIVLTAPTATVLPYQAFDESLVGTWVNGFVVGGGLAFHSGPLKFSPEVRYTRWAAPNFRSAIPYAFNLNSNQLDFLLGLAWSRLPPR
jgi:hypothetical protein